MLPKSTTTLPARLLVPVTLVLLVTVIGTLGYAWLGRNQGATMLDALYMTVITITTIGYAEIIELDETGRLFTIFIAITGIGRSPPAVRPSAARGRAQEVEVAALVGLQHVLEVEAPVPALERPGGLGRRPAA